MWRSGSTYIWSCFRSLPGTYCFYEPLNQGLGKLTRERIGRDTADRVAGNKHPELSAPYFAEYEPLLKGRGVPKFDPRFSYHNYALTLKDADPLLHVYINSLTAYAQKTGKQAVLGFNRTGLRMGWMARQMGGTHIHIDRHPRAIWQSYQKHMEAGHYTYFTAWLMTLEANKGLPFLQPLTKRLPLTRWLSKPKAHYRKALERMGPAQTYYMTFYMWLATTLHGLSFADAVIDMDMLHETDYRLDTAQRIKQLSGLVPDFSEAQPTQTPKILYDVEQEAVQDFPLKEFRAFLNKKRLKQNLARLSEAKAKHIKI
jgi:hypothetical protein